MSIVFYIDQYRLVKAHADACFRELTPKGLTIFSEDDQRKSAPDPAGRSGPETQRPSRVLHLALARDLGEDHPCENEKRPDETGTPNRSPSIT